MAERVPSSAARKRIAELLRRAAAGESFELTHRGSVVAVLGPARTAQEPLEAPRTSEIPSDPPKAPASLIPSRRLGAPAGLTMLELAKLTRR